jgi:hypothetical protein
MSVATGVYFLAIAYVLAQLEIQIEGPHGWAAKLPTWRWDSARVLRWAGKPITGYHFYLMTFILLFIHLPLLSQPWSLEREAETMSQFFLLAVFWDFLWFVCNPHFGLARFNAGQVWWFKKWMLGFPASYFTGLLLSAAVYAAPGLQASSALTGGERAARWGSVFAVLAAGAVGMVAVHARRRVPVAEVAKT